MPVGFNSPARNLFLLGSSGAQVVTNFFKTIDQSAGTDGVYLPDEIKYNFVDQKFILAGSAEDSNSKGFGWFEKRNETGVADWDVRIEAGAGINTTLRAMELDSNDNLIVVGKSGNAPWIAKYSNGGVIDWQATTFSGDVEYTGVTSDSNGIYYACGNTPTSGSAQAFVEKYTSTGTPDWGKSAFMLGRDVVLNSIAANTRGEVVAVGYLEDDVYNKGYIVKIDTNTGDVLWDRTLEPDWQGDMLNCTDVYIDSNDQIYVTVNGNFVGYLLKYTAEGNMIWQKVSNDSAASTITFDQVKSDGETEQTIVFGTYTDPNTNDVGGVLSKYSKSGNLVWRRTLFSSFNNSDTFANVSLDADPSFYYLLYIDGPVSGLNGTPESYTFGKVSSSGNGLGNFQYADGTGQIIDYEILSVGDTIGRLSDGSVRQDTSDLITYPFTANKLVFDDLATQVSNKKRQMDGPDSFEYSGSPAIRPADFQELNLLGSVYSGSGDWLDQSGKGNTGVTSFTTSAEEPFPGAGSVEFDGNGDYLSFASSSGFALGTGDWTVEYFAYPTSTTQYQRHFYLIGSNSNQIEGIFADSNGISFGRTNVWAPAQVSHTLNQWNHYALVHDSTNMRLYINGTQVLTDANNFVDENKSLHIGYSNSTFGGYFTGFMSNFRIVNGTALYTSNFTPPTTALTNTGFTAGNDYTGTVTSVTNAQANFNLANAYLLFDGTINTTGYGGGNNGSGFATVNFDGSVTWSSSIEVAGNMGASSGQVGGNTGFMRVNGFDVVPEMKAANQYATNPSIVWVDVTSKVGSSGTLNNIGAEWISGVANPFWGGIRLDGVHLIDTPATGTQLLTAQGGSISDASDNSFSITVNGNAAAAVGGTNTVTHNAGGWFEFDGVNDYISGSSPILFGTNTGSIEAWFKTSDTSTPGGAIYSESQPGDSTYWGHVRIHGGKPRFVLDDNSVLPEIEANVTVSDGNWHHVVVTGDGSNYGMYVDGVSYTPTYFSGSGYKWFNDTPGLTTFTIGALERTTIGNYFNGDIGDVRIYPRALTAGQVFQNYNSTKEKYTGVAASTNPGLTSTRTP